METPTVSKVADRDPEGARSKYPLSKTRRDWINYRDSPHSGSSEVEGASGWRPSPVGQGLSIFLVSLCSLVCEDQLNFR